jgi:hypothetical protein
MGYKIGEVTKTGRIVLSATSLLETGIARISLAQALKANQFGWRIVPGTVEAVEGYDYVTVHVRRARVPSNYV